MHEQYSSVIELASEEHVAFVPGHGLWSGKTARSFWVALVRLTHVSAQSIVILILNEAWVANSSIPRTNWHRIQWKIYIFVAKMDIISPMASHVPQRYSTITQRADGSAYMYSICLPMKQQFITRTTVTLPSVPEDRSFHFLVGNHASILQGKTKQE
jgi:hypothetical protein